MLRNILLASLLAALIGVTAFMWLRDPINTTVVNDAVGATVSAYEAQRQPQQQSTLEALSATREALERDLDAALRSTP